MTAFSSKMQWYHVQKNQPSWVCWTDLHDAKSMFKHMVIPWGHLPEHVITTPSRAQKALGWFKYYAPPWFPQTLQCAPVQVLCSVPAVVAAPHLILGQRSPKVPQLKIEGKHHTWLDAQYSTLLVLLTMTKPFLVAESNGEITSGTLCCVLCGWLISRNVVKLVISEGGKIVLGRFGEGRMRWFEWCWGCAWHCPVSRWSCPGAVRLLWPTS